MRLFLILITCALPNWGALGSISFIVPNCSGVARTNEGATSGVPIPKSAAITDTRNLMVTDSSDVVIDSWISAAERFGGAPDDTSKNIRVVHIDFKATVSATSGTHPCNGALTGGEATYKLKDRVGANPGTVALTATTDSSCSVNCRVIATGAATYKIRGDYFNGFNNVSLSGGATPVDISGAPTTGGLQWTSNTATYISAHVGDGTACAAPTFGNMPYCSTIEQGNQTSDANHSGTQVKAVVRVQGAFWNGATKKHRYDARISWYAGDVNWKFEPVINYTEDMYDVANQPIDMALIIPTTLGNSLTATFGTTWYTPATSTSVTMTNTDSVYLSQFDHGNVVAPDGHTITAGSSDSGGNNNYVCNDLTAANAASGINCAGLNLKGYRGVKNTTTQFDGNQAAGWMNLRDGTNYAAIALNDCWQKYPCEVEADGTKLKIHFWPKHGDSLTDGRSVGDLTSINGYKRDMGMTNAAGFQHWWPFKPGAALQLAVESLNAARIVTAATQANPMVITGTGTNASNPNIDSKNFSVPNCKGPCIFWDVGVQHRIYLSGFSGAYVGANGYKLGTNVGTITAPLISIQNLNGTNFDSSALGVPVLTLAKMSSIDQQNDTQADGTSFQYEVFGTFGAGSGTTGNDFARWRDPLFLTNPTYFCDTAQIYGRVHARDTINFTQAELELDAAYVNMQRKIHFTNLYGLFYGIGLYQNSAAGFGQRYLAPFRRNHIFSWYLQFIRTGDPAMFHMGRVHAWGSSDLFIQHIPFDQVDQTQAVASPLYQTKNYVDSLNNQIAKHNGSNSCTEGWGASPWWNIYNVATFWNLTQPPNGTLQTCPNGQQPAVEYPSSGLEADYTLSGHAHSKQVVTEIADHILFVASANHDGIMNESSDMYQGGTFSPVYGRTFYGGFAGTIPAHRMTGSVGVGKNYLDFADRIIQANIQVKVGGTVATPLGDLHENPLGLPLGAAASPSNKYGEQYFAHIWNWSLGEYVFVRDDNTPIAPPTYAVGNFNHSVAPQDVITKVGKGAMSYMPDNKTTGAYIYHFGGRTVADAYFYSGEAELLKYIKRVLDFSAYGADSDGTATGCSNPGGTNVTGAIPKTTCTLGQGLPDNHVWAPFTLSLPYMEYVLVGQSPAKPDIPPAFWVIPTVGATNAPLTSVTNKAADQSWTFSLYTRTTGSNDFGTLGIPMPASGDIIVDVLRPNGTSAVGYPQTFKTPHKGVPQVAAPGTNTCTAGALVANDAPSFSYNGGLNDTDNHYKTFTVPADGQTGEYKINVTVNNCTTPVGATKHVVAIAQNSLGNVSTVTCVSPCNNTNQFQNTENSSIVYFNVPSGVTTLQVDALGLNELVSPTGNLYRSSGGTNLTGLAPDNGFWALMNSSTWTSESAFGNRQISVTGTGTGVKPLVSPSPQYYWDSPNYAPITRVALANGGVFALTFSGSTCVITNGTPLASGQATVAYSVGFAVHASCAAVTNWAITAGSIPSGLTLNAGTGVLSGTPTTPNTYNFTVQATDGVTNPSKSFQLLIVAAPSACQIASGTPLPGGMVGVAYPSTNIQTINCVPPLTFSVSAGAMPTGLVLDTVNGIVSGLPSVANSFNFTIQVVDFTLAADTQPYTVLIDPPPGGGPGGVVTIGITIKEGVTVH